MRSTLGWLVLSPLFVSLLFSQARLAPTVLELSKLNTPKPDRTDYLLRDFGHGTYRGANPAQHLSLEFSSQSVSIRHPDGSIGLHFDGYGFGSRLQEPAAGELIVAGARAEYRRSNIREWYENRKDGLEQEFTLAARPDAGDDDGPLTIVFRVAGRLASSMKADRGAILFGSALRYTGLKAVDAQGHVLPSRMEVSGQQIRLFVDEQGAAYPLVVDPVWTQAAELTPPDGTVGNEFGSSVAISGNTAVIGSPLFNNSQGVAYVYVLSGGAWTLQQELAASDAAAVSLFGVSVAIDGNTIVVGSTYTSNGNGAAYVFVRTAGVWTQQQKLTASDGAPSDLFGNQVALNGNVAVIGAPGKNGYQGAAYVFSRGGSVWSQQQELTASDGNADDEFGTSVAISGNAMLISASGPSGDGTVYAFAWNGSSWGETQELDGGDDGSQFGQSVALSGNTAIIGSTASAAVFSSTGGTWSLQQSLSPPGQLPESFGNSVCLSGNVAVVGAPGGNNLAGAAYLFAGSAGQWSLAQTLTASGSTALGTAVAISGNLAAIGSPGNNAAYMYGGAALATTSQLLGGTAGSSSVELSTNFPWTATANDAFLHVSAGSASGTGNAVVVFTYDAFAGTGTRTGTLTIGGVTLTVTQVGSAYIAPGALTTIIGPDAAIPEGLAVDTSGTLYLSNTTYNDILSWTTATQRLATSVAASYGLTFPTNLAIDNSGNIYFDEFDSNDVFEFSPATQQLTTLISSGLSSPRSLAVDGVGDLFIADTGNQAVKEWNASTQQVTTLVSGVQAGGLAVDFIGNVYFSTPSSSVDEWQSSTQQVTTLVSQGLNTPAGLAVDGAGNVYIADYDNNAVKIWSPATQQATVLADTGTSSYPNGVALDSSGDVYVAESYSGSVIDIPYAFVGPAALSEGYSAGTDSLLVIPATTPLNGVFAPSTDQSWLTIGTVAGGTINFSFGLNPSYLPRTGHIIVLGNQITVTQAGVPTPTITKTHQGNFVQGQTGVVYTITVANPAGGLTTSGSITVTEQVPNGLTLISMTSTDAGWNCAAGTSCTRTDPLYPGSSFAPITVTVNVSASAPASVTNSAALTYGGQVYSATDPTTIAVPLSIGTSTVPVATQYQSYNTTLLAIGGNQPYTWSILSSSGVSLPEGMALDPATGIVSAAQVYGQGGYAVTVEVTDSTTPVAGVATATLNFGVNSDSTYGGCQMFPSDSIFNQRADSLPVDANPADQILPANLSSNFHPDFGHGFYPTPGGIPFMRVPANQSLSNVNLASDGQIDPAGTYSWPFPAWPNALIEGTSYGLAGNDHHFLLLQSSVNNINGPQTGACTLYEAYQSAPVPSIYDAGTNTWSFIAGVNYILNSDELAASQSTLDTGAQQVSGIPILPLLVKYSEVPLLAQHPLRLSLPTPTNGFVWPATGCCSGSGPPLGELYRLKASVNWQAVCPAATNPQAATVLQALQQYGAYLSWHDVAGGIQGVPDVRWNDNDLACIDNFPLSDLEPVNNSVLEVSGISGQTQPYLVPATLAGGAVAAAYSASIGEVGGTPTTLVWTVTSGALPPGLSLNASTGAISGTVTSAAGTPYNFAVTVTDTTSSYVSQAQAYSIAIASSPVTIGKSHSANFVQGQTGASYTILVANTGTTSTSGVVTVTDTLPPGLTATSIAGAGWSCTLGTLTCQSNGSLAAGTSYALTITVNVAANASSVTNQASASINGTVVAMANDPTTIFSPCDFTQTGMVNVWDAQTVVNQALGESWPVDDLNHDGAVNAIDVQIVINAVLGGICTAIQ
jgi:uncharacterized repeat protein (TIGR01451 family)